MTSFSRFISNVFKKYPKTSNTIVYGTLCVSAEISQQTVTRKLLPDDKQPYDTGAIVRFMTYGCLIGGPIVTYWYRYLDKILPGTAKATIIKKVLVDQFLFTSSLLVVFYTSMSYMEKKDDLFKELREKFVPTFQTSCVFWLPAQTINFCILPPAFRVVYVASCSFAWVNILCYLKRQ